MRRRIIIIAVTAVLLAGAVIIEKHCALPTWQLLLVYLIPYLLVGAPTLKEAAEGIAHGDVFNENFLMTVATLSASASCPERRPSFPKPSSSCCSSL